MSKTNKEVTVKEADEKATKMGVELCVQGILKEALKLYRQETHSVQQMLAYVRQLDKSGDLADLEEEINEELGQGEDLDPSDDDKTPEGEGDQNPEGDDSGSDEDKDKDPEDTKPETPQEPEKPAPKNQKGNQKGNAKKK